MSANKAAPDLPHKITPVLYERRAEQNYFNRYEETAMALTAAHKKYREKNPAHKKGEDEKRLDLVISGEAMAALKLNCKSAGITRRQLLEAMALSAFNYHTGVMMIPDITLGLHEEAGTGVNITPVLSAEAAIVAEATPALPEEVVTPVLEVPPAPDNGIESRILLMIEGGFIKGVTSPIPKQIVHEIYDGNYPEAAKRIRILATKYKSTEAGENLKMLANRIDGSKPKITKP